MTARSFLSCLALLVSTATVACTGSTPNDAPILDSVDAPLAVKAQDGVYAIRMTLLFHDNDRELVTHVRYRVGTSFDRVVELETPDPTRESAEVTLLLPKAACGGADHPQIDISILDARGAESHPLPRIFFLN